MKAGDALLFALAIWICGSFFATCTADAQPSAHATPEEILAALTVNESDFDSPGDMWGIFAVLSNIASARGVSWMRAAHMHSPHTAGLVLMRERPLQKFAAPPQ